MLLLGFFSKREHKAPKSQLGDSVSITTTSLLSDSPEADYILPSPHIPTRPNGHNIYASPSEPVSSSSMLKFPFRRKNNAQSSRNSNEKSIISLNDPDRAPKSSWMSSSSAASDADSPGLLRPPPKSIFGGPHDGVLSTRSLPAEPTNSLGKDTPPLPPPKKSFFGWRERTKSKPSAPRPPSPPPVDSFNLKSFRHVRPESPNPPPISRPPSALSSYSPAPPPPMPAARPRGNSNASDTSQRISVAAFREAQARRSANSSPIPPFRPVSTADTITPRSRSGQSGSPQSQNKGAGPNVRRSQAVSSHSTSSESEEEDSDSDDGSDSRPLGRKRTITKRSQAQSEMGHGSSRSSGGLSYLTTSQSSQQITQPSNTQEAVRPRPAGAQTGSIYSRPRASVSTSALTPNGAAKRANALAAANANVEPLPSPRKETHRRSNSDSSASSNSDEDAPLATLLNPSRPGSSASGLRSRTPVKPLVDIRVVMEGRDRVAFVHKSEEKVDDKEKWKADERFSPARPAAGHRRTSSDIVMSGSFLPDSIDGDDSPAPSSGIRVVTNSPNEDFASMINFDSLRSESPVKSTIVPTRIQQRQSPPSFAVTSRPQPKKSQTVDPSMMSSSPSSSKMRMNTAPEIRTIASSSSSQTRSERRFSHERTDSSSSVGRVSVSSARPRSNTLLSFSSASRPSTPPPPLPTKKMPAVTNSPSARARSATLINAIHHSDATSSSSPTPAPAVPAKPRSNTLISLIPPSPTKSSLPMPSASHTPAKPWSARRESPASSTGDSSSGRLPLTPRDGADIRWSGASEKASPVGRHSKKGSVNFDKDDGTVWGRGRERTVVRDRIERGSMDDDESRRRERRRSEAKNAIELGNVVNGRGPIIDDDEEDLPLTSTAAGSMNMLNPMMPMGGFGAPQLSASWSAFPQGSAPMMAPPPQLMADPNFIAAHQQAMMIAKQAYQYAVAQQALAAANDEWERGSSVSGFGGFGMGLGMGMGMPGGWPSGPMVFPSGAASVYGGSVGGGSEFGWGARSAYGDSFGPRPGDRSSIVSRQGIPMSSSRSAFGQRSEYGGPTSSTGPNGTLRPRPRTNTAPSNASRGSKKPPPPSSWKAGP